MTDYTQIERTLTRTLSLIHRPVAVAFRDSAPEGVQKFVGVQPSGCSFWMLASSGQAGRGASCCCSKPPPARV